MTPAPALARGRTIASGRSGGCRREDDDLEGAAARMASGAVRRLVVTDVSNRFVGILSVDDIALRSPALAGEIVEHVRAPERPPIQRGPWPWWETPGS